MRRSRRRSRDAISSRRASPAIRASPAWRSPRCAPGPTRRRRRVEVLLMRATVEQYLHEFDALGAQPRAAARAAGHARQPQAWLTLATVLSRAGPLRRVGRARARSVAAPAPTCMPRACRAENAALRGDVARRARAASQRLLAAPGLAGATRNWLLTTAGRARGARRAAAGRGRRRLPRRARAATRRLHAHRLRRLPDRAGPPGRGAAAAAGRAAQRRRAAAPGDRGQRRRMRRRRARDVAEMRERIALANERPGGANVFMAASRRCSRCASSTTPRARSRWRAATSRQQREPLDLLVFAQAARAARPGAAPSQEASACARTIGLHDRRIDALL